MPVELPFRLPESSVKTQAVRFAEKIFSLPENYFPLTPKQAAQLMCFDEERIGAESIQRWIKVGILKPNNPPSLTKEEIVVLKLAQMNFATATTPLSFLEAHMLLSQQLQGSWFEHLIGILDKNHAGLRGSAKILNPFTDEEGHWWVDTTSPFTSRRNLAGWVSKNR